MKIRYRSVVTGEIRDVSVGSAEETTVKTDVYTVNGESRPQWVLEGDYEKTMAENAATNAGLKPIFGNHSRRLTPGEREMGISSYEQKLRENDPNGDEEEELEDGITAGAPASKPKPAPRRRSQSKRRTAA